jgi:hypothetical protein
MSKEPCETVIKIIGGFRSDGKPFYLDTFLEREGWWGVQKKENKDETHNDVPYIAKSDTAS